jgi:hypothetical protein
VDFLLITLTLLVSFGALAVFANRSRSALNIDFELEPNCLLTRWPLLFISGPRSLFYFTSYWNLYPSYLAEHGYEVFKLSLPWKNSTARKDYLRQFIQAQEQQGGKFHLIVDEYSMHEFSDVLKNSPSECLISLTVVSDRKSQQRDSSSLAPFPIPQETLSMPQQTLPASSFFVNLSYRLHLFMINKDYVPSLATLGYGTLENAHVLLQRAQVLAETDLREG